MAGSDFIHVNHLSALTYRIGLGFVVFIASFLLFSPFNAYAMTIVLDPGHGGIGTSGSGAIYQPYVEKNLNYELATRLRDELIEAGATVYMTRNDDMALSLEERSDVAASYGADLLISLHFNSSGPHDKAGCEVWTSYSEPYYSTGKAVGGYILEELNDLGFSNKGVKVKEGERGDYYGIVRNGTANGIPTIIVEHCFIDNVLDRLLLDSCGIEALAHADAQGIIRYMNEQGELLSASHNVGADTDEDISGSTSATSDISKPSFEPADALSKAHSVRESKLVRSVRETLSHGFSVAHKVQ